MKKRIVGAFSLLAIVLTAGSVVAINSKDANEVGAYYSPSTHYEVSDTASELASYYSSILDSDSGTTLLSKLQSLNSTKRKKTIGYDGIGTGTSGAVIYTDYDLNSTAKDSNGQTYGTKVASFYTKTAATGWNREHMWPNSHGGNNVEADILHTRPTIESENSSRGNSFYVEGKNSSSAGWDPYTAGYDAEVRGECARVILYCVVAYPSFTLSDANSHSTSNSNKDNMMGNMNTLIKWHFDYAPNVYEKNRNDGAEYLQGNRNPFVDHPEYVARIWSSFNSTVSTLCTNNESKYSSWTPGNYCNYGSNTPVNTDKVSISASSASISVGSTTTLSATSTDSGAITWTTSNSSVASISSSSSASGANITVTGVAAGTATITAKRTINGTQYSDTCAVTVTKVVSSLSKGSTSPNKTTYTAGESFDPTGLTITAIYSDSTQSNVTSSVVWTPDPLTAGTTSVTGTFGGKTIQITGLTVNQATEPEIIDSNSDLSVGDYVVLRTAAGVGVTGWNNNKDATVSETESEWKKFYVASASNSGFTLKDESANSFIATPGSENKFIYGSAATCRTDGDGHLICNSRYLCKNGTNYRFYTSISNYLPFFIYKVPLSSAKTLSSISVATAPTKTTYTTGEYFNPTGLVITRNYSDSTSDTYSYANHTSEFTFSPTTSTALTTSNVSVTITYGGKSCNQAITVNAAQKTLSSISVQTAPTKTTYVVDEYFDPTGLVVTRNYSDSTSDTYTYAGHTSEFSFNPMLSIPLTTGHTSVTITYGGKSCNQAITVNSSGGGSGGTDTVDGSVTAVSSSLEGWKTSGTGTYKDGSVKFDGSGDNVYKLDIFTGDASDNMTELVVTINGKINGTPTSANSYKVEAVDSQGNALASDIKTGASVVTTEYGDTVFTMSSGLSGCTGIRVTYVTKGAGNWGILSISWVAKYSTSGSASPITLITATVSKTFYVGETISTSDITVKDNNNKTVTGFTFANNGYQFTYSDAASGGASTSKTFTSAVSYNTLTCSLTVQVQRKAYATPSESSLEHTGSEFSVAGIGSSYGTNRTATVDGVTFTVSGYIYNSKLSLSSSKTSAPGSLINTTPYSTGITDVTVSGASPDIQLSTNGSTWVDLSSATTSTVNYHYLKIFYKNTSQSNYVNIASITVTLKGTESATNVANYIMYEDTTNQCEAKFDVAEGYFKGMSKPERTTFMTSTDYVIATARERFEAWARHEGKMINQSGDDYVISRNIIPGIVSSDNNKSIGIVVIVSLISISAIGGYFFISHRRKEQ